MHYLFEVTAKPGYTIEQYAEAWVRASELIQQAPGRRARGCTERSAMSAPRWPLPLGRARPRGMPRRSAPERVQEIIQSQAPFVEIRFIGEFEAPEWEVLPPGDG